MFTEDHLLEDYGLGTALKTLRHSSFLSAYYKITSNLAIVMI